MSIKPSYWPPSKKDASGLRLLRAIEQLKFRQELFGRTSPELAELYLKLVEDDLIRGIVMGAIMNLDEKNEYEKDIAFAFKLTGLNPRNPMHWRELLSVLCKVHFGDQERGRKNEWDKYVHVRRDCLKIEEKYKTKGNVSETAKLLRREYRKEYSNIKEGSLRKLVAKSKKFFDEILVGQFPSMPVSNMMSQEATQQGRPLSSAQAAVVVRLEGELAKLLKEQGPSREGKN
jgi:hypothetical protein